MSESELEQIVKMRYYNCERAVRLFLKRHENDRDMLDAFLYGPFDPQFFLVRSAQHTILHPLSLQQRSDSTVTLCMIMPALAIFFASRCFASLLRWLASFTS